MFSLPSAQYAVELDIVKPNAEKQTWKGPVQITHLVLSTSISIIIDLQATEWPDTQLYCKTEEVGNGHTQTT